LLDAEGEPYVATGQTILVAGWKEFYPYSKLEERVLPLLKVADEIIVLKLDLFSKETQPPGRYSQGSLIKLMEDHNLGTKSTRPEIIQKLYSRKYIEGIKSIEPSKVAFAIIDALDKHSNQVTKPEMTSDLEKEMDEIAAGKKPQQEVVDDSKKDLHEIMEVLFKEKDSVGADLRAALKSDSVLATCSKCGTGSIIMRTGKTGKRFAGCSNYPACVNSFPLPQNGVITPTTEICPECNAPIISVKKGRFSYKMCLTMTCKTKANWGKKKESTEKKEIVVEKKNSDEKIVVAKKENVGKARVESKTTKPKVPSKKSASKLKN